MYWIGSRGLFAGTSCDTGVRVPVPRGGGSFAASARERSCMIRFGRPDKTRQIECAR